MLYNRRSVEMRLLVKRYKVYLITLSPSNTPPLLFKAKTQDKKDGKRQERRSEPFPAA